MGPGKLHLAAPPKNFALRVLNRGPVFAEVESDYTMADKGYWRIRFRVIAGEPVILVDEQFEGPEGDFYVLKLNEGFDADHLLYRNGGETVTIPIKDATGATLFLLEPWLKWWGSMRGNWCGFYNAAGPDFLAVGLRDPACWVRPEKTAWPTSIEIGKGGLALPFQLRGLERKWMLITLPKERALEPTKGSAPPPQQLLIKHGDFPLQEVKNEVLEWPDRGLAHPRLFVTPAELESFRARFKVDKNQLAELRQASTAMYSLDDHIAYSLASRDEKLFALLSRDALQQLQSSVDLYLKQGALPTVGSDLHRHYNQVAPALNVLDAVLDPGGMLSHAERRKARAQIAFLGYTLASPAVLSPERGFNANPNMTTSTRCALGILACLIPDHPRAKAWAEMGIREMENELENWTGPNGGWLEAPHYMTVSMDAIVPLALALRQTTFTKADWARDPRLQKAIRWLGAISTPPDPRLGGARRMPEIGNTYTGERTCVPGWLARVYQESDPAFAKQMQWIWKQQGSFERPGLGGLYPGVTGYCALVLDPAIPAEAPPWGVNGSPKSGRLCARTSRELARLICIIFRAGCTSTMITTKARSSCGARARRCARISATMAARRPPTTAAWMMVTRKPPATREKSANSSPRGGPTTCMVNAPAGTGRFFSPKTGIRSDPIIFLSAIPSETAAPPSGACGSPRMPLPPPIPRGRRASPAGSARTSPSFLPKTPAGRSRPRSSAGRMERRDSPAR